MTTTRKILLSGLILGFLGLIYFGIILGTGSSYIDKRYILTNIDTGKEIEISDSQKSNPDSWSITDKDKYYQTGYYIKCYYFSDAFRGLDGESSTSYSVDNGFNNSYSDSVCISEARSEWIRKVIFIVLFPSIIILIGCGLGLLITILIGKKENNGLPPIPPANYHYTH